MIGWYLKRKIELRRYMRVSHHFHLSLTLSLSLCPNHRIFTNIMYSHNWCVRVVEFHFPPSPTATVQGPATESGTTVLSYQDHPPSQGRAEEDTPKLRLLRLLPVLPLKEGGHFDHLDPSPWRLCRWETISWSDGAVFGYSTGETQRQVTEAV